MKYLKIKRLFRKYLSDKTAPEEGQLVEQWYDKLDKRAPIQLSAAEEQALEEEMWKRIEPMLSAPQRSVSRLYTYISVAASIAVLVLAGVLYQKRNKAVEQKTADVSELFQDYYTRTGERKQLRLQDGSVIAMNSGSHIRVYPDFSKDRRVDLTDGEAYFDVQHDPAHPFIIRAGKVTTHVLGTAFNIRAYKELNEISVAVTAGKVQVADTLHTIGVLEKQQKLVFDQQRETFAIQHFTEDVAGWKSGKLIIRNVSFEEMALLLEKNYGITLTTSNAGIRKKKFTASIPSSLSATEAVEIIASIFKLKMKQGGDTIELYR
ncbi:FecR family protein [Chitinophaga agri]|uniref:Uncharacterized protein n=1 Tax=Chitinophaga agri TaxID=2703787 RepID=A0A6B9ZQH6_9BACT|nr:FecR family protein [Chitinophaga agri]QHS63203.1 hypothetical protein GWR21_27525 [Chitinophaga agri]